MKKALVLLTLLPLSLAKGELLAQVVTDKGTIVVDLQYAKAPKTVANFITLAQGTRARVDSVTGEVTKKPLYVGEKFYRVETTPGKLMQTGSGTGTITGGPGFIFRDEFDPTLTHVPYVLSMANAGPNTNGSQIFFTGSTAFPGLNNVHAVFGLVTDTASRGVIETILAAGSNATTITAVNIVRTDAPAINFKELEQALPEVTVLPSSLAVVPGTSVKALPTTPVGPWNEIRLFKSQNLSSWTSAGSLHVGGNAAPVTNITLDSVTPNSVPPSKAFYHLSKTRYQDDLTVSSLASANVLVQFSQGSFAYAFNAAGAGGTVTISLNGQPPDSGPFTLSSLNSQPYKLTMVIDHQGTLNPRYLRITANSDRFTGPQSAGRANIEYYDTITWFPLSSGTQTITH